MPGRPSDARCFSLSRPFSSLPHFIASSSFLHFSLFLFFLSSRLWTKGLWTLSHRHLPSRVHSPLAKYVKIFARIARHKYHSSAIPIGARSIAIDFFQVTTRSAIFVPSRILHSSMLHSLTKRLRSLQNAKKTFYERKLFLRYLILYFEIVY